MRNDGKSPFFYAVMAAVVVLVSGWNDAEKGYVSIDWDDLLPYAREPLKELEDYFGPDGEDSEPSTTDWDSDQYNAVVTDYDGKPVKIPGFLLPLAMGVDGANEFLLVPYTGACIHVPPPPPNQIIYVTTEEPFETMDFFEPVFVSGLFRTMAMSTEFAEVGYALSADKIEPYEYTR